MMSAGMSSTVSIMFARKLRSSGLHGANVTLQFPMSAEVMPWFTHGEIDASQAAWASMWVWRSTNPGVTMRPVASIVRVASAEILPMATMVSPLIAISASMGSEPSPSCTVPPRMIRS